MSCVSTSRHTRHQEALWTYSRHRDIRHTHTTHRDLRHTGSLCSRHRDMRHTHREPVCPMSRCVVYDIILETSRHTTLARDIHETHSRHTRHRHPRHREDLLISRHTRHREALLYTREREALLQMYILLQYCDTHREPLARDIRDIDIRDIKRLSSSRDLEIYDTRDIRDIERLSDTQESERLSCQRLSAGVYIITPIHTRGEPLARDIRERVSRHTREALSREALRGCVWV